MTGSPRTRRWRRKSRPTALPSRRRLPVEPPQRLRWAWWLLACASLALGLIGILLPGLPTVPFILLAGFASARGSQRLHRRLLAHARFGPMIRDWQAQGAVSLRAKWLATGMMAASGSAIMLLVAAWLWRRPEPQQKA